MLTAWGEVLTVWELALSPWEIVPTAWGDALIAWELVLSPCELPAWGGRHWLPGNQCSQPRNYLPEREQHYLLGDSADCLGRDTGCLGISALCLGTTCLRGAVLALPAWGLTLLVSQVIFPSFWRSNLLNFFICLSFILRNLSSLTLSINCWHLSMVEVDTIDTSCDLLNSLCLALSPRILLMDLTLAGRRSFSAFLIIF